MAAKIGLGQGIYLDDWTNYNNAYGRGIPYTQYLIDYDSCFKTLRTTINTMIDEIKAVQGPNATLGIDLLVFNDPNRTGPPIGVNSYGLIGLHSYLTYVGAPTTNLEVDPGDALMDGQKVSLSSGVTFPSGALGNGTYYIALDINGYPILETGPGLQQMDIYSVTLTGGVWSNPARIPECEIFFDGDEYEGMRGRPAAGTTPITFPALEFEQFHHRMEAVEALLAGLSADPQGNSLGQPAIRPGTVGAPGLVIAGSDDTGIYGTTTSVGISTSGVSRFLVTTTTLTATLPFRAADGSLGAVSYGFTTGAGVDGMYRVGTNRVGFQTNSLLRAELDAEGNLDLPTNARVQGVRTAARTSCTSGNLHLLEFNASDTFDIGNGTDNWHNDGGGSPGDEEFTVPTGCDGLYHLLFEFELEPAPASICEIEVYIFKNGTPPAVGTHEIATYKQISWGGATPENVAEPVQTYAVLAVGDVIRVGYRPTTAGAVDYDMDWFRLSIVKVA